MEEVPLRRQYMVKCPMTIPESGCHGKSEIYHNLGKLGKLFFKEVRLKFLVLQGCITCTKCLARPMKHTIAFNKLLG